jgi:hypothetical protein
MSTGWGDNEPSDAAVEAAARVRRPGLSWEALGSIDRDIHLRSARAALEAAYRVDAPRPLPTREQIMKRAVYDNNEMWISVDALMDLLSGEKS